MAIIRWRPWGSLGDDLLSRVPVGHEECRWVPAVDISEDEDNLFVDVEVPGMKKEDIKVSLEHNVLSLKGEKKQEKEVKEENYHRWERCYGSFSRAFELPIPVEADKIKASYRDGVLHVKLPKAEEVKPKEIPIEVK
jgi:HSP20 family protein